MFYPLLWILFSLTTKRLHDLGYAAWTSLVFLVPAVNVLSYFALIIAPGMKNQNQYGKVPTWVRVKHDEPGSAFNLKARLNIFASRLIGLKQNRNLVYFMYMGISTVTGFISGWYFKTPDQALLMKFYDARAEWRKDVINQMHKSEGFFFNPHYNFNWFAFFLTLGIVMFILLFFNQRSFREAVISRVRLKEEKEA